MSEIDISKYSIGVFVGRLQVHEIHDGHHYVINQVVSNHRKTIIFLGCPTFIGSKKNPLDFDTRKKMVEKFYPDSIILPIKDQSDNYRWVSEIDKRIREVYPHGDVLMYGSRDSFIPHYINGNGQFQTKELEPLGTFAGTNIRKMISEEVKNSVDFRSGIIYHAYNLYPKVIPITNVIPIDNDKILISKNYDESKWKFIGGFMTIEDQSNELSAKRIILKEVGNEFISDNYKYIGSSQIQDWRYRGEEDKVISNLFTCRYIGGVISPSSDISELKFIKINEINKEDFMNEHQNLVDIFLNQI